MRDWRNRQTRTFKGRVGDRVSSSLTSRTKYPKMSTLGGILGLFSYQSRPFWTAFFRVLKKI